jgi:hypothetical protein
MPSEIEASHNLKLRPFDYALNQNRDPSAEFTPSEEIQDSSLTLGMTSEGLRVTCGTALY